MPLPTSDSVSSLLSILQPPEPSGTTLPPTLVAIDAKKKTHTLRIAPGTEILSLSGLGVPTISLQPLALAAPSALRELSLAANALTTLDLTPLVDSCPALTSLSLNSNALTSLDLTPLATTPVLERLWLHDNALEQLDLAPLAHTPNLRSLYLDSNRLDNASLDLSPLATCVHLRALRLASNALCGSLEITPLLSVPALSQFVTDPHVKLIAYGTSAQARVSSALRRKVLDITWRTEGVVAMPPKPSIAGAAPQRSRHVHSRIGSGAPPSFGPATSTSSNLVISCAPARPRAVRSRSMPGGQNGSIAEAAKKTTGRRGGGGDGGAPLVVLALLIGFRRLSRYAAEDALAKCGKISIAAAQRAQNDVTGKVDADMIRAAHIAVIQAPEADELRLLASAAADVGTPLVVFGTERYRAKNAELLGGEGTAYTSVCFFLADPPSAAAASRVFNLGQTNAMRKAAEPQAKRAPLPPRGRNAVRGAGFGGYRKSPTPMPGRALSSASSTESDDDADVDDIDGFEIVKEEPRSFWREISDSLKKFKRPTSVQDENGEALSRRRNRNTFFDGCCKSSFSLLAESSEMILHCETRARAEKAALDVLFRDLHDAVTAFDFTAVARACGLPKCAGRLLFNAARQDGVRKDRGSASRVVSDSSACAAFGSSTCSSRDFCHENKQLLSSETFLAYWACRLQHFSPGLRLYNVICDSRTARDGLLEEQIEQDRRQRMHKQQQHVDPNPVVSNCSGETAGWQHSVVQQLSGGSSASTASSTDAPNDQRSASPPSDNGRRGLVGLRGCDAGVGELVQEFMLGRKGRFGMFALVKPSEAVAIGTALLLFELKSKCGTCVGGCARPVDMREVTGGNLCQALIEAESGIFEGVAGSLSMDKLRNIKGTFASVAAPEAVVAADTCALKYQLSAHEVEQYNAQRKLLLGRGVDALLAVHCHGRKEMTVSEFAVMHACNGAVDSIGAADYYFSTLDVDGDGFWSLADLAHFHSEKQRVLLQDKIAVWDLACLWSCLCDMMMPEAGTPGISRADFTRLEARDRKVVVASLLFLDDHHATLNIRQTLVLEGRSSDLPFGAV